MNARTKRDALTRYSEFRPSQFDTAGLGCPEQQDWCVVPCGRNRDSDCLTESNFHVALTRLEAAGDTADVDVKRFGHWACGWFEIILVCPDSPAYLEALAIVDGLEQYPVLDENDFSDRKHEAAQETWTHCYSTAQRIEYMRDHAEQFEFRSFANMLGCARGRYFTGAVSELLG